MKVVSSQFPLLSKYTSSARRALDPHGYLRHVSNQVSRRHATHAVLPRRRVAKPRYCGDGFDPGLGRKVSIFHNTRILRSHLLIPCFNFVQRSHGPYLASSSANTLMRCSERSQRLLAALRETFRSRAALMAENILLLQLSQREYPKPSELTLPAKSVGLRCRSSSR